MNIETYGTGARMRYVADLARSIEERHLVLLPVPTTKDGKHITNTDISLWQTLGGVGKGSSVFGYGLPDEYKNSAAALGARVFDLAKDEEYLKKNARLTAVGAVGYLLTTSSASPDSLKIGVSGYGRIGSELVKLLLFLGAEVKVFTTKMQTRIELAAYDVDSISVEECIGGVYDFSGLDILMNTAPKDMRSAFPNGNGEGGMRILELASGENFEGIEGVEKLPALPDKMYPISAAEAYISAVRRCL